MNGCIQIILITLLSVAGDAISASAAPPSAATCAMIIGVQNMEGLNASHIRGLEDTGSRPRAISRLRRLGFCHSDGSRARNS